MNNRHCGPHQICDYILNKKYKLKNYVHVNLHTLCPKFTICNGGGWLMVKRGKTINKQTPMEKYILIK
jgi:hypothetical protein